MSKPIRPEDVANQKVNVIPEEVFDAFNRLIIQKFRNGRAYIKQDEVISLIVGNPPKEIQNYSRGDAESYIYKHRWLDVEDAYREVGWKVTYDKPGYCESYTASFEFTYVK